MNRQSAPNQNGGGGLQSRWLAPVILGLAIGLFIALAVRFNFTQDDAFITFRYAANFVDGNGLVYNIGERVEGYTNFLWTIFMILGRLAGMELVIFSRIMGVACGLATIWVLHLLAGRLFGPDSAWRGVCCVFLGATYSYAYWSVAGLETAAFTLAVTSTLYFYLHRSYLVGPFMVMATLLRPEGGLLFLFLVLYDVIACRNFGRFTAVCVGIYLFSVLPYAAFKLSYYANLLPNPFYAKTDFTAARLIEGLEYTWLYLWHYLGAGIFVVPALLASRKTGRALIMPLTFIFLYMIYISLVGGDVLKVHRFFVPIMPLIALVVVFGIQRILKRPILILAALVIVLAWQTIVPLTHVKTYHHAEKRLIKKMEVMGSDLLAVDDRDFTLAVSTIGVLGYRLLGHTVIDMLGLTDSTVARHPEPEIEGMETTWRERRFNAGYLLSRQPDYILFSTGRKPSAPAERALFLYSRFLQNYRTIAFDVEGTRHDIFKRYYSIEETIIRDINPRFVDQYVKSFGLRIAGKYRQALAALEQAWRFLPDTVFSYIPYLMSENLRHLGDYKASYAVLRDCLERDTLVYEVYLDLMVYESRMNKDYEEAKIYRQKLADLMPWYEPRFRIISPEGQ
ncbi:MAG: tetratricopeptide repeat protein [Candidatus Zixiibacteriota bacterium]|nr:MAG: tetratricopeptide repeat protein [candidate division Zixibacteria bacterium]